MIEDPAMDFQISKKLENGSVRSLIRRFNPRSVQQNMFKGVVCGCIDSVLGTL